MKRIFIDKTPEFLGKKVKVAGWVNSIRSHGKLIFVDLRDFTGVLQTVFRNEKEELHKIAKKLRSEWVVELEGEISARPPKMVNPKIKTGKVELVVEKARVLSEAKTLPFPIETDGYEISEEKRLKYRYLDLRRERLKNNLIVRQKVIQFMREFLIERGFVEIETPILTKSTPEGARDFIVPSRLQKGKFYALPQSPQQYKQLLQVAGFERYFQIARCFRDEDPRADRQAEFTQIDMELSFVSQEDILTLIEEMIIGLVKNIFPQKHILQTPFPRLQYKEAMEKYGSDRPDLRKDKKSPDELAFAFIIDFPMFEWSEEEKRWKSVHHPFTRPQTENIVEIKNNPEKILAHQYDLVLNGYEIGGGSLRSYKKEVLEAVFEIMGHTKSEIQEKFGHLLEAFEYGVPPHGGIALGLDRLISLLVNEPNIREVIPFPKTGDSRDLMMNTPSEVSKEQLKELCLEVKKPEKNR